MWVLFVIAILHGTLSVYNRPFDTQKECEAYKATVTEAALKIDPATAKLSLTCFEPKPIGRLT